MYSTKIILAIAALAGTSLSQKSDSEFCSALETSLVVSVIAGAPTTPADVLSFIATKTLTTPPLTTPDFQAHAEQLCEIFAVLPSSLLPEFSSFASVLLRWGESYTSDFVGYIEDCQPEAEVESMTSALSHYFTATADLCPTPAPGGASNGTSPASPTPTAASDSLATSTTLIVTAAAVRPTGALLGAAAIGGVVGAAAML